MKFVAKVQLTSVTSYNYGDGKKFNFNPVQNEQGASAEDIEFCKYTPSGNLELHIDNPLLVANLELGDYFYVTFDKC